uniref:Putative mitochondrial processing peptidase alpha subunit n=1 Tax=Trypanosoma congolense (strain IL3000) TaxID=1068625 RepID=G0V029_TRYCI|nr:putative mitochondrial processing peptidase alpha subunit [Trypanosoma congolense IL3000]
MHRRAVAAAVPSAAAPAVRNVRSLSQYKFGQKPLTEAWPATVRPTPPPGAATTSVTAGSGNVKVTLFPNGTRVITQQRGGPVVSIGAYILAGPVYDPVGCPGLHHLMHLALTTSNYNSSLFQLDRSIRSTGAAFSHFEKDKHFIGIRLDARLDMWKSNTSGKTSVAKQFDLSLVQDTIFTAVSAPRFHEPDVERFRDTVDNNLKELRWQHPTQYAVQQLETVAFYKEPLGNPRHVPECSNGRITSRAMLDQYAKYVTPDRVVIAGVNVEHSELVAEYESAPYPHSSGSPHHAAFANGEGKLSFDVSKEQSQYTGGELHEHEDRPKEMCTKPDMDTETIVAVGYLAFGRNKACLKRYAATLVFQQLFNIVIQDGTRYEQDVVLDGVRSFYQPYQYAGLLGFTVVADPETVVQLVKSGIKTINSVKFDNTAAVEVAKHRAAVELISQSWDTVRDACDYLGTSLPFDAKATNSTQYISPEEVLAAIRSVTPDELQQVKECMAGSKPTLFGHGEMMAFPSLRQLGA